MKTACLKVPFLDLRVSEKEREEILASIDKVLTHGRLILGPEVSDLEQEVAEYCNRKYAVGMNSGTDALFLALKALGVGPGDEVITTCLSWVATANSIALTGATVVFCDIREDLNIDPQKVELLITPRTKAIVPVHYTGRICDMNPLIELAKKHDIFLVEDAAQAFGAFHNKKVAGSFGKIACFSMNPMKVFAACGEAGMVLTDDEEIYQRLIALRYNGTINKEKCIVSSLNCRLDTIQAAILLQRLKGVEFLIAKRRETASYYNQRLSFLVRTPRELPEERHIYYTYIIQTLKRDELQKYLSDKGIETKIQHPYLMPQQPIYQRYSRPLPVGEKAVREILCLPVHEKLALEEREYVAETVASFFS